MFCNYISNKRLKKLTQIINQILLSLMDCSFQSRGNFGFIFGLSTRCCLEKCWELLAKAERPNVSLQLLLTTTNETFGTQSFKMVAFQSLKSGKNPRKRLLVSFVGSEGVKMFDFFWGFPSVSASNRRRKFSYQLESSLKNLTFG